MLINVQLSFIGFSMFVKDISCQRS